MRRLFDENQMVLPHLSISQSHEIARCKVDHILKLAEIEACVSLPARLRRLWFKYLCHPSRWGFNVDVERCIYVLLLFIILISLLSYKHCY